MSEMKFYFFKRFTFQTYFNPKSISKQFKLRRELALSFFVNHCETCLIKLITPTSPFLPIVLQTNFKGDCRRISTADDHFVWRMALGIVFYSHGCLFSVCSLTAFNIFESWKPYCGQFVWNGDTKQNEQNVFKPEEYFLQLSPQFVVHEALTLKKVYQISI